MNRKGSVSIVLVVLVLAGLAAAGWFLFRPEESGAPVPRPQPEVPAPGPQITAPEVEPIKPIQTSRDAEQRAPESPTLRSQRGNPTELAGRVLDEFGNPVGAATVQMVDISPSNDVTKRMHDRFQKRVLAQTASAADGSYKFENLRPEARHYLMASAPGYIDQIKDHIEVGLMVNFTLRKGAATEGVVRDSRSQKPVPDARVRAWFKSVATDANLYYRFEEFTNTDENGRFRFNALPIEVVTIMVYHDSYNDFLDQQVRIEAGKVNELTLEIVRGIDVAGVVRDRLTDEPIPGAFVSVSDNPFIMKRNARTDQEGRFLIRGLEEGTQAFSVTCSGYTSMRESRTVVADDDVSKTGPEGLALRMDPTGSAAGRVLSPDGSPIANANVYVARQNPLVAQVRGRAEYRTQADGTFLVADLGTDTSFFVAAFADGFGIGVSESFSVGPRELRDGIEVRLTRGCGIAGVVADEDSVPVAGARIEVAIPPFADVWFPPGNDIGQPTTRIVVTGDDGRYELGGLWKGSFTFSITHDRMVPIVKQTVVVRDVDQQLAQDFRMQIGRHLAGTCSDTSGAPAVGAEVTVSRPWSEAVEARTTVDEEGMWRVDGLVKGTFRVQARLPGFSSEPMSEVPHDSENLHFRLRENGSLIGSAVGPDGAPIKRFVLSLVPQHDGSGKEFQEAMKHAPTPRSFVDEAGRFLYENVDPGVYILTARAENLPDLTIENVNVPAGGAQNTELRFTRGGGLRGLVIDRSTSAPVMDAVVTVRPVMERGEAKPAISEGGDADRPFGGAIRDSWTARPGRDGMYEVLGLPSGDYRIDVQTTRHVSLPQETVHVDEGQETRRDFTLEVAGEVVVTVVDDLGDPVPGASVMIRDVAQGRRPYGVQGGPRADNQGKVALRNVPPGSFKLSVQRSGYESREVDVRLQGGDKAQETVTIPKIR